MAALLERVRNHQTHPVMSEAERKAEYGTHTPTRLRASLSASQRNAPKPKQADSYYEDNADVQARILPTTDDLDSEDEDPATGKQSLAITTWRGNGGNTIPPRSGGQQVTYNNPQANGLVWSVIWKVIFGILSAILTVLILLYTIVFVIVAGWIAVSNSWQYGQSHTASTQAMINGTPTTIITSNINGTIYVTLVSKESPAKTYTGPVLDANAWGGDPGSVVATATVGKGSSPTITVSLIGTVNYLRPLFVRPQITFALVPDKQGYKVAQS